ncbi:MAG: hypothetical protein QW275_02360 [Candidatus Anstonellaceae archaeon]
MWLVVLLLAAFASISAYLFLPKHRKQYKLGFLALMLFGLAVMVSVDRAIAVMGGDPLISHSTEGIIESSLLLGIAMLVPILLIWLASIYFSSQTSADRSA